MSSGGVLASGSEKVPRFLSDTYIKRKRAESSDNAPMLTGLPADFAALLTGVVNGCPAARTGFADGGRWKFARLFCREVANV
eukprot:5232471-Pyramimonas_sp.AAC.1